MKLVASMIVGEVEADRYIVPCIASLLEFCDEVVMLFDGDGEWATDLRGVFGDDGSRTIGVIDAGVDFFAHEGRARQRLLDVTLEREPTHILALDADEFVADGPGLRLSIEHRQDIPVWWLQMEEIWETAPDGLCVREDGGWASHSIPALWRVPDRLDASWRINDRALACGRVPRPVDTFSPPLPPVTEILHFGWANEAERDTRYQRYVIADGGRFHASAHLQSIMWPCDKIKLRPRAWPSGLARHRAMIAGRAGIVAG